jgi:hypothetical protein
MTFPSFTAGEVLRAQDMNAVGLWLVKSHNVGTGVSSVTVPSAFSADYESYKIIWTGGTASTNVDLYLTLGASSAYNWSAVYSAFNATPSAAGTTTGTYFNYSGGATTTWGGANFELHRPFLTQATFYNAQHVNFAAGINTVGFLNNSTSYSSFTLTPSSGTITGGTIRVYGYQK